MILLNNIDKHYIETTGQKQVIFESASVDLSNHNSISIMGRSGSGKTTLLNILSGLDIHYRGCFLFDGAEMEKSKRKMTEFRLHNVGIVSQNYQLLTDRSVLENVALPLYCRKVNGSDARKEAYNVLSIVGVSHLAKKSAKKISGGEAQRVAIARALVKRPKLIIADEPTGALDEATEFDIMNLFIEIATNTKIIIATHSNDVSGFCDAVYHIDKRKVNRA